MKAGSRIPYRDTNSFSDIVNAYLQESNDLRGFYSKPPNLDGIKKAAKEKAGAVDRSVLVEVLRSQYGKLDPSASVANNINALTNENCFTICTAHQPNLATGPLYV